MRISQYLILMCILLFMNCTYHRGTYMAFSGIHNTSEGQIDRFLDSLQIGKITYYYDDVNEIGGEWELYPRLQINKSFFIVNVSTIPGNEFYNYLIFLDTDRWRIADIMGPYYDSHVDSIAVVMDDNSIAGISVKLTNPPEEGEPRSTEMKYERIDEELILSGIDSD